MIIIYVHLIYCVAQCIGDLSAKLPYKRIADYGIIMSGLPSGKQLKHPSSYGRLTLKEILENKDNIKVEGVHQLPYKIVYYVHMYVIIQ